MAEATFLSGDQNRIDHTDAGAVEAGTVLILGGGANKLIAVNNVPLIAGVQTGVDIAGKYTFASDGTEFEVGTILSWDDTANQMKADASGFFNNAAVVVEKPAAGGSTVRAKLIPDATTTATA